MKLLGPALLVFGLLLGQTGYAALSDPTYLAKYAGSPGATTFDIASAAYTTGDLVVVVGAARDGEYPTSLSANTFSTGAWTIDPNASTTYGAPGISIWYAYAQVTTGATGTITVTLNTTAGNQILAHSYRVPSGFDVTTPVAQTGKASTTTAAEMNDGDSVTGAFSSAPSSNSALIAWGSGSTVNNGMTSIAGWTVGSQDYGGNLPSASAVDSGSTSTTYGMAVEFADQTGVVAVLGLEIQEATAGGSVIPVLHHQLRNQ